MGATSSVQSRLGLRSAVQLMTRLMARDSPETVETISPTPRFSIGSLVNVGEDLRPTKETITTVSGTDWHATHSMSDRCGSNGRGYRGKDTRHCDHVSACPPIVGWLPAFWGECMHIVLHALEVCIVCRLTGGRYRTISPQGLPPLCTSFNDLSCYLIRIGAARGVQLSASSGKRGLKFG